MPGNSDSLTWRIKNRTQKIECCGWLLFFVFFFLNTYIRTYFRTFFSPESTAKTTFNLSTFVRDLLLLYICIWFLFLMDSQGSCAIVQSRITLRLSNKKKCARTAARGLCARGSVYLSGEPFFFLHVLSLSHATDNMIRGEEGGRKMSPNWKLFRCRELFIITQYSIAISI